LEAHHSAWYTRFAAGEPAPAHDHCSTGRGLYDFERHRTLASSYGGHDPGVCACQHAALLDWLLGYPDRAVTAIEEALSIAQRLRHPLSLSHALIYYSVLHLFRGEARPALHRADEAEALSNEQLVARVVNTNILRGAAIFAGGEFKEATSSIRAGLAARQSWQLARQYQLTLVAEVLDRAGEHDNALAMLAEAEAAIRVGGDRWWEPEVHRQKGLILLSQNRVADGESAFQTSLTVARAQQAKSLELRAAMSLARLWGEQGRRVEARALLAPVYGWFTEGFDTADLKEAKALLDELT
jgi:predicted ATPase